MNYLNQNASIIYQGVEISNCEIRKEINDIKSKIIEEINDNESVVAIMISKSPKLLYLIISLIELELTFVLIDKKCPVNRLGIIVKKAKVDIVITENDEKCQDLNYTHMNLKKIEKEKEKIVYILFTSGTTGEPKGVEIYKESLDNFLIGIKEKIDVTDKDIIGCFTNQMFDIFLLESVFALAHGLTIVLANDIESKNPRAILKLILENGINILQITPSRLQLLLCCDREYKIIKNIKKFLIGGECFPKRLLNDLQRNTDASIYNMYGPTETTIWSTVSNLTNSKEINIGKPIANTDIVIIDEEYNILELDKKGEICISGIGLARGYRDDMKKTNEKFVVLKNGIKYYRTGDIGMKNREGILYCYGRNDNQIKKNGFRIELEEIENVALNTIKFNDVMVCYDESKNAIIMFYIADDEFHKNDIVKKLSDFLPDYMIPTMFIKVKSFTYNSHGKKDRKKMLQYSEENKEITKMEITKNLLNEVGIILHKILKNYEISFVGDMQLSDIGIDSLLYIQLLAELEKLYNIQFEDEKLIFESEITIDHLVKYIEDKVV